MVETLEHLIRQSCEHPRHSRTPLYKELLRSEAFLLTVDEPLEAETATRVSHADESFPVWADKDPELGGVWVPVFPSRDSVSSYVSGRKLKAPKGKEFLWMGQKPGAVFPLLRHVRCFAGLRLVLDDKSTVAIDWSDVKTLAEGRLPSESPEVYELPVAELVLPRGLRMAFGRVALGPADGDGKLLCLPDAGHFRAEDVRKLVRLPLGEQETAWMACRHFLQVLRLLRGPGATKRYVEDMLCSLVGFEMFGEAEALCDWLLRRGAQAYAWVAMAVIYARTGRLAECADHCRRAARRYPKEKTFVIHGAKAYLRLGRKEDASALLSQALDRFPGDASLLSALQECA